MNCECTDGICWCIGPEQEVDPAAFSAEIAHQLNQRLRLSLRTSRRLRLGRGGLPNRNLHPKARQMVRDGVLPEDLADIAHRLTHPEEYATPEAQLDAEYDLDAYPDAGADLDTEDALDLEDDTTDAALASETGEGPDPYQDHTLSLYDGMIEDAPADVDADRCPECGYPGTDAGACQYCGGGDMDAQDMPADQAPPEVDADGFTEGDQGDYPLPGWHDLSPEQQAQAREQFKRFLARQDQEQGQATDRAPSGRRADGSFTLFE